MSNLHQASGNSRIAVLKQEREVCIERIADAQKVIEHFTAMLRVVERRIEVFIANRDRRIAAMSEERCKSMTRDAEGRWLPNPQSDTAVTLSAINSNSVDSAR